MATSSENFEERDDTAQQQIPFIDSRLIGPSQDERSGAYLELELKAKLKAEERAQSDINRYKYQGESFPTREYLRDDALSKAFDAMTFTYFQKGKLDTAPLRQHYLQAYMRAYDNYLAEAGLNGMVATEEERKIQQIAREDALQSKQTGIDLSDIELTCHAAIRAQEYLGMDTQTTAYLTHILKYMQVYKHEYREEKDRTTRSVPFSGRQPGR